MPGSMPSVKSRRSTPIFASRSIVSRWRSRHAFPRTCRFGRRPSSPTRSIPSRIRSARPTATGSPRRSRPAAGHHCSIAGPSHGRDTISTSPGCRPRRNGSSANTTSPASPRSTTRTIHHCHVRESASGEVEIEIAGSGFLYNMVRIVAGTLHEIGRGRFDGERIDEILATGDRRLAGPTMPPEGLCLMWIRYPGDAECSA
ncbi:MAG: tRNA pseudouridine synthase A [Planctomycetota bacterium]